MPYKHLNDYERNVICHLHSFGLSKAERDWLIERSAGMTPTWSEHLAWVDDTEFAVLMRQRENTGRPLGDADFVKEIGRELSRDQLPKKPKIRKV